MTLSRSNCPDSVLKGLGVGDGVRRLGSGGVVGLTPPNTLSLLLRPSSSGAVGDRLGVTGAC